jgi:hypothetical protein
MWRQTCRTPSVAIHNRNSSYHRESGNAGHRNNRARRACRRDGNRTGT